MSRSERHTEPNEIRKNFKIADGKNKTAGPIIFWENGKSYYDDSEAHIEVDGKTGMGKSGCVSTAYVINCLIAGENVTCIDPKGDLYERTACIAEKTHRVICLDFRNPRKSPDKWNPLLAPYKFYSSNDPDSLDIASSQISEMARDIYPHDAHSDPFWANSAADYFTGLVYALFETGSKEEINMDSIAAMMDASEVRFANTTFIKDYASLFAEDSMANRNLASYVTAPNETRASIHSVAANGLSVFSRSRGLMDLLSQDTVGINELDMEEKPLAIYCIIPDETNTYDSLAALFVSQLTQHFIRLAHDKYHGRLPIRMNLILEELASVGKSLSNLPNLMVAARSRNIRIMLVLQNGNSQLTDVYGKSKAATINSCVGITFAFSTNSWETLNEWSQRCGERQVEIRGNIVKEPLITASQLAAMPVGTALILINNQYKYVARLPFYNEMFDMSGWHEPSITKRSFVNKSKAFDMKNYVKQQREKKINEMLNGDSSERTSTPINPFSLESPSTIDTSDLVARIDAKIAELEAQEEAEKKDKERKIIHYSVVVLNYGSSRISAVRAVRETLHVPIDVANNMLRTLPAEINVDSKKTAESLMKAIVEIGGIATVKKEET